MECRVLEHFVKASATATILLYVSHVLLIKPLLDDELPIRVGPGFGALWFDATGPGEEATNQAR